MPPTCDAKPGVLRYCGKGNKAWATLPLKPAYGIGIPAARASGELILASSKLPRLKADRGSAFMFSAPLAGIRCTSRKTSGSAMPTRGWKPSTPMIARTSSDGYLAALAAEEPWSAEYRMRTRDGRTIWVHDETTLIHDDEGRNAMLLGRDLRHHRAQARRACAARIGAARARGRRAPAGARRDEEHVPRRGVARAPQSAHRDPRAWRSPSSARRWSRTTATTSWSAWPRTPGSSTVC